MADLLNGLSEAEYRMRYPFLAGYDPKKPVPEGWLPTTPSAQWQYRWQDVGEPAAYATMEGAIPGGFGRYGGLVGGFPTARALQWRASQLTPGGVSPYFSQQERQAFEGIGQTGLTGLDVRIADAMGAPKPGTFLGVPLWERDVKERTPAFTEAWRTGLLQGIPLAGTSAALAPEGGLTDVEAVGRLGALADQNSVYRELYGDYSALSAYDAALRGGPDAIGALPDAVKDRLLRLGFTHPALYPPPPPPPPPTVVTVPTDPYTIDGGGSGGKGPGDTDHGGRDSSGDNPGDDSGGRGHGGAGEANV